MPRRKAEAIEIGEGGTISTFADLLASKLGKDSVSVMSGDFASHVSDWISTQSPTLDALIGHPGIPVGRVTTFVGPTSTGRTTLCYHILAETQLRGGVAVYIDAESAALDAERAREIGVDPENLIIIVPSSAEKACEAIEQIVENADKAWPGRIVTIVLDSVAGLAPQAELDAEYEDRVIAGLARVFNRSMRTLPGKIGRTKCALVIVNQWRTNIGGGPFGPTKVMPAEAPIEYASSVIVEISRTGKLTESGGGEADEKEAYGIQCKAYVKKNKVAKPFKTGFYKLLFEARDGSNAGININDSLFILGRRAGLVKAPSVGWYEYEGTKFREKEFSKILMDNPSLATEIIKSMNLPEEYPPHSKIGTMMHNYLEVGV